MPEQLQVSHKQAAILQKIIRGHQSPQSLVTRAKIVLGGAQYGKRNKQIARELDVNERTVKTWRERWLAGEAMLETIEQDGAEKELQEAIEQLLADQPRSGKPATFSAEQVCQIIAVACESPALSNRPITEWTPRELADEVIKREIVETISASQVRLFLKRGGVETASKSLLAQPQTPGKSRAV
jgi:putative transposase